MRRPATMLLTLLLAIGLAPAAAHAQGVVAEHLVISEVNYDGIDQGSARTDNYVEIFNPTGATIPLDAIYLTNTPYRYIDVSNSNVTGIRLDDHEWIYRFPDGAALDPGCFAVVTSDAATFLEWHSGNDDPNATFAERLATFRERGAQLFEVSENPGNGVPEMEAIHSLIGAGGTLLRRMTLHNAGRLVCLFTWDGTIDGRVFDIDAVSWATDASSFHQLDKTGLLAADGTPYADDLGHDPSTEPWAPRGRSNTPSTGHRDSAHRISLLQTGQIPSGGNGITGNDVSTELWSDTFETRDMAAGENPLLGDAAASIQDALDIGAVAFGESRAVPLTIESTGDVALVVAAVDVVPAGSGFEVIGVDLPLVVPAGQEREIEVRLNASASAPGLREAELLIQTRHVRVDQQAPEKNRIDFETHIVDVQGESAEPGALEVHGAALDGGALTFALTRVGGARTEQLTFSNTGQTELTVTELRLEPAGAFTIDLAPFTLAGQEAVVREVTFRPPSAGAHEARLQIASNDPTVPMRSFDLAGEGVQVGNPGRSGGGAACAFGSAPATGALPMLLAGLALLGLRRRRG